LTSECNFVENVALLKTIFKSGASSMLLQHFLIYAERNCFSNFKTLCLQHFWLYENENYP